MGQILNSGYFIMEINTLVDQSTRANFNVSPTLNFIEAAGTTGALQLGSGANWGAGPVTVEGDLTNVEVKENKNNKGYQVRMDIFGGGATSNIFISVNPDGSASGSVRGIRGKGYDARGWVKALRDTRTYKASPKF